MGDRGRGRLVISLVAVVFLALSTGPVDAQESAPIVRIESTASPAVIFGCGDDPPLAHPGEVVLSRTGDTTNALTVSYDLTGPVVPRSSSAEFQPGEDTVAIALVPLIDGSPTGAIDIGLLDADSYDLGDPATATIHVAEAHCDVFGPPEPAPPEAPNPPIAEPRFTG